MAKSILKIIASCIVAYPIVYIISYLEGSKDNNLWLPLLIIDVIVCIALIIWTASRHRLKSKNKRNPNDDA